MSEHSDPQAEREAIFAQLRSKKRAESMAALESIKARGWLNDGSLEGAYLYGAKWQHTDLRGAILRGCTLSGIVLEGADLSGADFTGAEMIDCNMKNVTARQAKFVGVDAIAAKLHNADLTDADLTGMTLGNATLSFTRFHHTRLDDVDLNNAIFDNTLLAAVDLSTVQNLERVRHYAPSAVDTATLLQSKGIALDFWRGCGISESVIAALSAMRAMPDPYYNVYISYSNPDRHMAQAVQQALQEAGLRCWLHEHQIERDVDFYKRMKLGFRAQDRVILIASPSALNSWWIEDELSAALARGIQHHGGETPALFSITTTPDLAQQAAPDLMERLSAYPMHDFSDVDDTLTLQTRLESILQALRR